MASSLSLNRTRKVPAEDTAAFGAIAERFRRGGALERAVSLCREGLQKFPDHVSARVTLGWSLLDLGKYDEARLELEQVLRRAPDNLAAIRGLAELHDRFEHTLNLPMDGPGQWPPPPEATDHIADDPIAANPLALSVDASDPAEVEFAPAELGIPIWSPAPAAFSESAIDVDSEPEVVVHAAPAPGAPPVAAVSVPVPPPMTAVASPAAAVGAGMSSVREIEMTPASDWAGISAATAGESATVEIDSAESGVAFAGGDTTAADDAEIAALIAEAESLESAADLTAPAGAHAPADLSLDTSAPMDADDLALELSVAADASDDVDLPLVLDAVAPQYAGEAPEAELAGEIVVQAGSVEWAGPAAELAPAGPDIDVQAEAAAVVEETAAAPALLVEAALEIAPSEASAAIEEVPVELAASVSTVVEEEHVEPASSLIDQGPSFELTAFTPTDVAAEDEPAAVEAVAASVDESLAPVLPFHIVPVHPALPALERLLAQVQTRRSQLMAQSVA
jgi:hypothetical protein